MNILTPAIDVSSFVPQAFAAYRPLLEDGLVFFLQRIPAGRMAKALHEQDSLPATTGIPERLGILLRHFPTLHKLGQIVSRERRLPHELRQRLQVLESLRPTTPMSAITPIIRHELGNYVEGGVQLASEALAEASVAVVVPFSFAASKKSAKVCEGVLKVLKPDIEEHFTEELNIWSALGAFLDERCEKYGLPALNYAENLDTVRVLLSNEIRLNSEQQHLAEAANFYADCSFVRIPNILPFCSKRITAMERIRGRKVTDVADLSDTVRKRLAGVVTEGLIARPIWGAEFSAMFHADPHAGNLFFTNDGKLAILDWSLIGHLGKAERIQTAQIVLGLLTFDAERIVRAITRLACRTPNQSALLEVVNKALRELSLSKPPGFRQLVALFDDAKILAGVQFSAELTLFRKSLLTLEGVLADVCPDNSIDAVLATLAARHLFGELPKRSLASPISRDFATHLSNVDLLVLFGSMPSIAARYWMSFWAQRMENMRNGIGSGTN